MFHVVSNGFVLHCVEHLRCIYCVLLLVGFMSHHTSIMSSGIWMHLASCCWLSHYDICSYHWTMFMTMALNGDQIFLSNLNHPPKLSGWKSVRWSIWQQRPRNDSWNTGHREARCHDVVMNVIMMKLWCNYEEMIKSHYISPTKKKGSKKIQVPNAFVLAKCRWGVWGMMTSRRRRTRRSTMRKDSWILVPRHRKCWIWRWRRF